MIKTQWLSHGIHDKSITDNCMELEKESAHLARLLDSPSQHNIPFILPTSGLCHVINSITWTDFVLYLIVDIWWMISLSTSICPCFTAGIGNKPIRFTLPPSCVIPAASSSRATALVLKLINKTVRINKMWFYHPFLQNKFVRTYVHSLFQALRW